VAGSSAKTSVLHVWQDNETDVDLLGFHVHADLIRSVITDPGVLPVSVGVFGDWGGGKSSIMKMLKKDLSDEGAYPNVVCLYFNGWTFEGYEDAKSALLTSILIQLGDHKKFGPKVKDWVVKLLKRVKWMELGKLSIKHVGIPLAAGMLTGGIGAVPAVAAAMAASALPGLKDSDDGDKDKKDKEETDWSALIEAEPGKADILGVRKFRDEFTTMLGKTDIMSLVVLIDDLDRCLPERLIETLEAIKLFVAVPKTAFVIGADPRIVRHAISTRYVKRQLQHTATEETVAARDEEEKLITDYLEKLIQVPYQLPRLSPAEIETYLNLLACEKLLDGKSLDTILKAWKEMRVENVYAPCTGSVIQKALGETFELPPALKDQLDWSTTVASVITDGLKGNPRQVKRMLNALSLRKQLASIARIAIKEEVLAKLMVLEYSNLLLFQELNQWQAAEKGMPANLSNLEKYALKDEAEEEPASDDGLARWRKPSMLSWLRMRPQLTNEDLRDYFWLARDKTGSTLSGVVMIPPEVQAAIQSILSDNGGEQAKAVKAVQQFSEPNRLLILDLLKQEAERHIDRKESTSGLHTLAVNKVPGAAQKLFETARSIPASKLRPAVPNNIAELAQVEPALRSQAVAVLTEIAKSEATGAGKAAKLALGTLAKKGA
jgi:predicted KAP-like P-loop ATPase